MIYKVTGCHFIVDLDIYYKGILFAFGYSKDRLCRVLDGFDGKDVPELKKMYRKQPLNYKGLTCVGKNGTIMIVMPQMPTTADHFGTISHEIFHAVEGIMDNIDNPLRSGDNSESWAHMIGFVTAQVQEKLADYYR